MNRPTSPDLSAEELATAAQVTVERIRELETLRLLTGHDGGFDRGDVSRVRLVEACERAGIGAESLSQAVARGRLSLAFLDLQQYEWPSHIERTFGELCAERGLDPGFARRMFENASLPAPDPDVQARTDDSPLLALIATASGTGLDEHVIVRAMRLYGEHLRRMAAAETNLYHDLIEVPVMRSGMSEVQMRELTSRMVDPIDEPLRAAVDVIWQRHREHHWLADMVEHIEQSLEDLGLATPRDPPAMCFADLSGYTRFTEEHGDARAADLAGAIGDIATEVNRDHNGVTVKWLGDGVMSYFPAPHDGIRGALALVHRVDEQGLPPAHVGIAAGPVVIREGDYFGRTVNLASRVADVAAPRQVLVTDEVAHRAGDVPLRPLGEVELKGVPEPIRLHEIVAS